jgi:predicted phosphodiesterase
VRAIVSDIHSNIEALTAVFKDMQKRRVSEILCLGDVIGYGPNPREALLKAIKYFKFTCQGNHEDAVMLLAEDFSLEAKHAIDWTRDQLNRRDVSKEENHQLWDFLDTFKQVVNEGDFYFVHGSPRQPTREYVLPSDAGTEKMTEIFSMFDRICFTGHTHFPGVFSEDGTFQHPTQIDHRWDFKPGQKFLINVGSVGQPRDRDTRSCYVTFDEEHVEWHRVPYDYRTTQKKIIATGKLPKYLADRLEKGR